MEFDWDELKAAQNLAKHRVSFDEAASVFRDDQALLTFDEDHSSYEDRYRTMGFSFSGRLLVVTHRLEDGIVRIISARKPTRRESRAYEQNRP